MSTTLRLCTTEPSLAQARRRGAYRFAQLIEVVAVWRRRLRSRRELAGLDVRLLHDIGLDPYEADREANKPFWRA